MDETSMSKEDNDNVNNNSTNSSGNNAAKETQTGNLNSCTTETELKLPCENEPKDGIEEVSPSIEKEELDVKMDTSDTDNLILVTNSSVDNSLSDDSKTKEESLDTTISNNPNSNNFQNVESVK